MYFSLIRGVMVHLPLVLFLLGCSPRTGEGESATAERKPVEPPEVKAVEPRPVLLINPGFESGWNHWTLVDPSGQAALSSEALHEGAQGVRLKNSEDIDTVLSSKPMVVDTSKVYHLSFYSRMISGSGASVALRFFDATGNWINTYPINDALNVQSGNWKQWSVTAYPPTAAKTVAVWIVVKGSKLSRITVDFDEFALEADDLVQQAPWPGEYKLRPDQKDRLTAADVIGPDGLVYPNWKGVGVTGGISSLPIAVGPEMFESKREQDIVDTLRAAIDLAADKGGGVVQLPAGTFYLDRPLFVTRDRVVIRGAGRDATRLIYRAYVPPGKLELHYWGDVKEFGPGAVVEIWANPKNLNTLELRVDQKPMISETRRDHWGNRYAVWIYASELLSKVGPGSHSLEASAKYDDGKVLTQTFSVEVSEKPVQSPRHGQTGAIMITGTGSPGKKILLTRDAVRGAQNLSLSSDHGLKTDDCIEIEAPPTPRWNKLVGNQSPWGSYRVNQYRVLEVDGDIVRIDRPLRLDFPVQDGSFVRSINVCNRSGIESLTIEQLVRTPNPQGPKLPETLWYPIEDLWTSGVIMHYAWDCWVQNVCVINAGRCPFYTVNSRSCELRNSELVGAIFKGGGGSGYAGFERSFDCLMENVTTRDLRHSPTVQWGAAGNVVRKCHFYGSDAQWHAGWTNENLFENNVIISRLEDVKRNGNYGFGLFGSGPEVPTHGPQGPRNVVYGNDITAPHGGLVMLGGNEGWLILYNRFQCEDGYAIRGGAKGFDHIVQNNVFVIKSPKDPAVFFTSPDNVGIELVGNRFYGDFKRISGFGGAFGRLARDESNTIAPYDETVARLHPDVESIFLWQRPDRKEVSASTSEQSELRRGQP